MDKAIFEIVEKELNRQRTHLELIASENFVSQEVLAITGSVLTNKYAEGYPGKRYYGGCQYVDEAELLAINRLKKLFNAEHANVQPHSGSQANMAVYMSILEHGDKVLGMSLSDGGHLTHGHPLNFSGMSYQFFGYGVNPVTEQIDYDAVLKLALEIKPKLIVAGASAYPRKIDFSKFREIADQVGAYLMVDMAHIAGLVAAGLHQNPVPYADFVTSTTHKTMRGPRGGIILCKQEHAKKLDQRVFPGMQGGPLMHVIAAKAVCFYEALLPSFKIYQAQVIKNAKVMAETFMDAGLRVVSNGTDNHLMLIDVLGSVGLTGKEAESLLDSVYITVNKNSIPNDKEKPMITSGIRLGTPAMTTRGMKEAEAREIALMMIDCLKNPSDEAVLNDCRSRVQALTDRFPLYQNQEEK